MHTSPLVRGHDLGPVHVLPKANSFSRGPYTYRISSWLSWSAQIGISSSRKLWQVNRPTHFWPSCEPE